MLKYILLAIVVLGLLALVWWLVSRSSAHRQQEQADAAKAQARARQQAAVEAARREVAETAAATSVAVAAAAPTQPEPTQPSLHAGVSSESDEVLVLPVPADEVAPQVDEVPTDVDEVAPQVGEDVEAETTILPAQAVDLPVLSPEQVALGHGFADDVEQPVGDEPSSPSEQVTAGVEDLEPKPETAAVEPEPEPETAVLAPEPEQEAPVAVREQQVREVESSEPAGHAARRISEYDEVVDGGFGPGSAAPIEDRAQPMGHAIQAYRDTMTYRVESSPGYDSVEPDVWFYDEESARRAGFRPSTQ